jgi:hypothetical protein
MRPQTIILPIFGALLAHALPFSESLYTRADDLTSREIVAREPTSFTNEVTDLSPSESFDLDRRTISGTVAAAAIPGICDLGHKIYSGIFVYVNCPAPTKNLKDAFANLAKAGKQAINFEPAWDEEQRIQAVVAASPANMLKGNGKVSLRQALKETANQLNIASFIIMDRAASAVYRAGGTHADVGGKELHPGGPVPDVVVTPPQANPKPPKPSNGLLAPPEKPTNLKASLPPPKPTVKPVAKPAPKVVAPPPKAVVKPKKTKTT